MLELKAPRVSAPKAMVEQISMEHIECELCHGKGKYSKYMGGPAYRDTLGLVTVDCPICHGKGYLTARITIDWREPD